MLRKFLILLFLATPLNGLAVGQDTVFNMTGDFELRDPTVTIPSPDVNGFDGASFEFEVVYEQGSEAMTIPPFGGDQVFQSAASATLTITGASDGSNGTFTSSTLVLFRPGAGDFGRSIGAIGFGPVNFDGTEVDLRSSNGSAAIGRLLEPVGAPISDSLTIDQFGSPEPSPIIFSDFANNFDPTMQSDYGVTNLVITVTGPPQITHGDVNMDGVTSFLDIAPFISALSMAGMGEFQPQADCNDDGVVNFLDIAPFIMALTNA